MVQYCKLTKSVPWNRPVMWKITHWSSQLVKDSVITRKKRKLKLNYANPMASCPIKFYSAQRANKLAPLFFNIMAPHPLASGGLVYALGTKPLWQLICDRVNSNPDVKACGLFKSTRNWLKLVLQQRARGRHASNSQRWMQLNINSGWRHPQRREIAGNNSWLSAMADLRRCAATRHRIHVNADTMQTDATGNVCILNFYQPQASMQKLYKSINNFPK